MLVGVYSVAGLYLGRAMRNSSTYIGLDQVLLVGGTSAAAAYAAPMITHRITCPHSASAPFINAGVSSALMWLALQAESMDADSASMFVPVQIGSSLLAEYTSKEMWQKQGGYAQPPHAGSSGPAADAANAADAAVTGGGGWSPFDKDLHGFATNSPRLHCGGSKCSQGGSWLKHL
jgi:hypothetical protein